MANPSDYLATAAILAIQEIDTSKVEIPTHLDDLVSLINETYGVIVEGPRIWLIIAKLEKLGMVEVVRDSYAGDLLNIRRSLFDAAPSKIAEVVDGHVLKAVAVGGSALFDRVFKSPQFWTNLDIEVEALKSGIEFEKSIEFKSSIPASDRIVRRDDNQASLEEIEEGLVELSKLVLSQDNETGDKIGDQRDVIENEIEVARQVISRPSFRPSSLIGWLTPVLRFLADKFAGGAIADAAKRLLDLVLTLVQ